VFVCAVTPTHARSREGAQLKKVDKPIGGAAGGAGAMGSGGGIGDMIARALLERRIALSDDKEKNSTHADDWDD
jgi:hypothetical protein